MSHQARGSRTGKVVTVLHKAGVDGLTIGDIAAATGVKPYDVKTVLHALAARHPRQAEQIAIRRPDALASDRRVQEVWACRCRLIEQHKPNDAPPPDPVRLDESTIESGRHGLATARAALEASSNRRTA